MSLTDIFIKAKSRHQRGTPTIDGKVIIDVVAEGKAFHAEPCTLLVFIEDATSKLMQLRLVPSESTDSYFEALSEYLIEHGCPTAFYSDKHTVLRVRDLRRKAVRT